MFNDVEDMAAAASVLARYPRLRDAACSDNLSAFTTVTSRKRCRIWP